MDLPQGGRGDVLENTGQGQVSLFLLSMGDGSRSPSRDEETPLRQWKALHGHQHRWL